MKMARLLHRFLKGCKQVSEFGTSQAVLSFVYFSELNSFEALSFDFA